MKSPFCHDPHDSAGSRAALRVTVLCGGPSAEREISLESGRAVAAALERCGHDVYMSDIGPDDLRALDHPCDVIFPALHGTFGEDGQVQRIMEERGLRFVGADARASALAMNKVATKQLAENAGIETPPYEVWTSNEIANGAVSQMTVPVVVKPVDQGSSVGTAIVREEAALGAALRAAAACSGRVLVEKFVGGDELTVGIIGTEPLPPICIRPKRNFYDYEAKYADDATEYLFDAGYGADVLKRAQELSCKLFTQLGCRHLGRVDWIIDAGLRLWLLEINTLPGFTSHSLVPKAAAHVGVSFEELVDRLVRMAYEEQA